MHQIFLSYAEEDSDLCRDIAARLEQAGHGCWYYERNTVAGRSYLAQVAEGIRSAQVFVLIASPASLGSYQVTKEVEQAHQRNRPIVPILRDVTEQDIEQRQPSWYAALATMAWIDAAALHGARVAEEIVRSVRAFGCSPQTEARADGLAPATVSSHAVDRHTPTILWASDGNQIEIPRLKEMVFQTPVIAEFLRSDQKFFLSANKGLGKTLLMRFKRSLLADRYFHRDEEQPTGRAMVHFVPEGHPYLDLMSDLPTISKGHNRFLSDLRTCKRAWSFALRISALSHFPDLVAAESVLDSEVLPTRIARWLTGKRVEPTVVFRELLSFSLKEVNRVLDQFENSLDFVFRNIHSGVYLFLDKVDQGIRSVDREAWINIQGGLIDAAWDVMNANSHIKVYASLREEAYANYESDIKANAYGATTTLRYSHEDLARLIDKLTRFYEGAGSFSDFVQHHSIRNQRGEVVEDSFRYLHRHTVGRPRDLVIVCSELSRRQGRLTESLFRSIVTETASEKIVPNIFDEMHVFLNSLRDRKERHRLWAMLPHNVLTRQDLEQICCRYNGVELSEFSDYQTSGGKGLSHPFCELYDCGLLGCIREDQATGIERQQFKQPHDMSAEWSCGLPASPYYVLHPALQAMIHTLRSGTEYRVFRFLVVGHGYPWRDYFPALIEIQRRLFCVADREVLAAVEEFLSAVHAALSEQRPRQLSWNDFGVADVRPLLEQKGLDDLYLTIDQLITDFLTERE
ncbi:MAG: toll/interleukin-1 receptor domain-containing protein [Planctomycetaceae bacterium]|nr:toll/interleukin-1 receptor domain-containing protein [Planctomycetaceae bacterium]